MQQGQQEASKYNEPIISNQVIKSTTLLFYSWQWSIPVQEKNPANFYSIITLRPKRPIFLTSPEGSILVSYTKVHFISVHERASDICIKDAQVKERFKDTLLLFKDSSLE